MEAWLLQDFKNPEDGVLYSRVTQFIVHANKAGVRALVKSTTRANKKNILKIGWRAREKEKLVHFVGICFWLIFGEKGMDGFWEGS